MQLKKLIEDGNLEQLSEFQALNKEQLSTLIKLKQKEKAEIDRQIKILKRKAKALHYGFDLGDAVMNKASGKIWVVTGFDGHAFFGYYHTSGGTWSNFEKTMYGEPSEFEKMEGFGIWQKFKNGAAIKELRPDNRGIIFEKVSDHHARTAQFGDQLVEMKETHRRLFFQANAKWPK